MLNIKKEHLGATTHITLLDEQSILVLRTISYKNYRFVVDIDGSVGDFAKKINSVIEIDNNTFMTFDRIAREVGYEGN
jgi:hypothetical protein